MNFLTAINRSRGELLGTRVRLADRWWLRARGLLGTSGLRAGEGLLLLPCSSIHSFGMSYPIDVIFLSTTGQVVALYERLGPWRFSGRHRRACCALELPSGAVERSGTRTGDRVEVLWRQTERAGLKRDGRLLPLPDPLPFTRRRD